MVAIDFQIKYCIDKCKIKDHAMQPFHTIDTICSIKFEGCHFKILWVFFNFVWNSWDKYTLVGGRFSIWTESHKIIINFAVFTTFSFCVVTLSTRFLSIVTWVLPKKLMDPWPWVLQYAENIQHHGLPHHFIILVPELRRAWFGRSHRVAIDSSFLS